MAKKYADMGFKFIFVYTRETHPGENYLAHQTLEQKLDHACSLKKVLDAQRPILVDDVEGTGHELYGALPNMTYVIDRGGKVLFRSDWTDPPTMSKTLASSAGKVCGWHPSMPRWLGTGGATWRSIMRCWKRPDLRHCPTGRTAKSPALNNRLGRAGYRSKTQSPPFQGGNIGEVLPVERTTHCGLPSNRGTFVLIGETSHWRSHVAPICCLFIGVT